jgi:small subunit ribosomal protein S3
LRANIDYGFAEANTTYGKIGVKVWIFKGEIIGKPAIDEQKTTAETGRRTDLVGVVRETGEPARRKRRTLSERPTRDRRTRRRSNWTERTSTSERPAPTKRGRERRR